VIKYPKVSDNLKTMLSLSGYKTLNFIYESSNSEVYRAIKETNQESVILKLLKEDYPTRSELTRYKQEYQLTHSLDRKGIIKAYDLKLMSKNAEDRYQSAWGLKTDLETCLTQLETQGEIDSFPLGAEDLSDKFQIPQKLYGRQKEIEQLLNIFEQVDRNNQMMLVAGYSGIGKSALVQEIDKPITQRKGYFISGKFDQFQRNVPYSAIVSAFKEFVQQLLTESPENLEKWKTKLLQALGVNGQIIIEVIPEIELIIGPQPPIDKLEPTESQNRFNLVFQHFIHCCCSPEHPLVIFLDDLQWTDRATLKLIKLIVMDKNLKNLLLIGAYRDNEVNVKHPFITLIDKLKNNQICIHELTLKNLVINDVRHLIEDTVIQDNKKVQELSKMIFNKTRGNPFFVNQFLSNLYSENLIEFNYKNQVWEWDLYKIKSQNITDNVVELMIGKLRKLPLNTQEVLKLAACIGANFDLTTLSLVSGNNSPEVFNCIIPAIQSGLVLSLSELDPELLIQDYRFVHDRVQQAAYALIPEEDKPSIHLKIGQLLLKSSSEEEQSENIFDIVGHLNIGFDRLTNDEEKNKITQLNLEAGKKAKSSAAYMGSLEYLKAGMDQLSNDS